ncbi:hypothetical protein MTO96_009226 [Rhipicephalus appendiculatus]
MPICGGAPCCGGHRSETPAASLA